MTEQTIKASSVRGQQGQQARPTPSTPPTKTAMPRLGLWAQTKPWLEAFWPLLATALGTWYFDDAVAETIRSTTHPELVYLLLGGFAAGAVLLVYTLGRYLREQSLARWLREQSGEARIQWLKAPGWRSDILPVYRLTFMGGQGNVISRHTVTQHELALGEERLFARLALPGFISGSLVGLGLVGTFVGLLGTLADLGTLFSALSGGGGGGGDTGAMFSDMVAKLQAPMRGMGTSFVASLYGLMGSLILGLIMQSVRRLGQRAMEVIAGVVEHTVLEQAAQTQPQALSSVQAPSEAQSSGVLAAAGAVLSESVLEPLRRQVQAFAERIEALLGALSMQQTGLSKLAETSAVEWRAAEKRHVGLLSALESTTQSVTAVHERQLSQMGEILKVMQHQSEQMGVWTQRLIQAQRHSSWRFAGVVAAVLIPVALALMAFERLVLDAVAPRSAVAVSAAAPAAPALPPAAPPVQDGQPAAAEGEAPAAASASSTDPTEPVETVTVQPGETLSGLAETHGVSWSELRRANPQVGNPHRIRAGQQIRLPAGHAATQDRP